LSNLIKLQVVFPQGLSFLPTHFSLQSFETRRDGERLAALDSPSEQTRILRNKQAGFLTLTFGNECNALCGAVLYADKTG